MLSVSLLEFLVMFFVDDGILVNFLSILDLLVSKLTFLRYQPVLDLLILQLQGLVRLHLLIQLLHHVLQHLLSNRTLLLLTEFSVFILELRYLYF